MFNRKDIEPADFWKPNGKNKKRKNEFTVPIIERKKNKQKTPQIKIPPDRIRHWWD